MNAANRVRTGIYAWPDLGLSQPKHGKHAGNVQELLHAVLLGAAHPDQIGPVPGHYDKGADVGRRTTRRNLMRLPFQNDTHDTVSSTSSLGLPSNHTQIPSTAKGSN